MRRRWHSHGYEHWRRPIRLQRRVFLTFGIGIFAAMLTSGIVFSTLHGAGFHWMRPLALFAAGLVLWVSSGLVARRIAAPLVELTRVARDLGEGKLERRARLPRRDTTEVGELASAFNVMAERIATQIKSQKELLGAVSHELRTPLARLRVLLSMLQEAGASPELTAKVEREIVEMDALVGELLAGARVDAGALNARTLDLGDLVRECVERSGLTTVHIALDADARSVIADATLVSRALLVLLDNTQKHGGREVRVLATREGKGVRLYVEDDGPGFDAADLPHVFSPFTRGRGQAPDEGRGVGLGLYLVRRIAEAHGGSAFAENRPSGGSRVGIVLNVPR